MIDWKFFLLALVAVLVFCVADRVYGLRAMFTRLRDALRSARRYLGRE
jgi:hypothetical protein